MFLNMSGLFKFLGSGGAIVEEKGTWGAELIDSIKPVLIAIFAVVGALAAFYAIWVGFMLAKAEDQGKRQQAKKRFLNILVGLFIIIIITPVMIAWDTSDTTDRVYYSVGNCNIGYDEAKSGKKIEFSRSGSILSENIGFAVKEKENNNLSIGSTDGVVRLTGESTSGGYLSVDISYNGEVKLSNVLVIVRAKNETQKTLAASNGNSPGLPGVFEDAQYELKANSIDTYARSYVGVSGYSQTTRKSGMRDTHQVINGETTPTVQLPFFDCSGFVQHVFGKFNITIPTSAVLANDSSVANNIAENLKNQGKEVSTPKPGDIYWYSGHIGIYLGKMNVRKFGDVNNENNGRVISGNHVVISASGATQNDSPSTYADTKGRFFYYSDYGNTYRTGVVYASITPTESKYKFFRL